MGIWARERQWQAEKVTGAEMILQCSQRERVGANECAVGCAGCLRVQLCANWAYDCELGCGGRRASKNKSGSAR
jgi:hypothetical protein